MNLNPDQNESGGAPKESAGTASSFLAELRGGGGAEVVEGAPTSTSKIKLTGPTLVLFAVAGAGAALLAGMRQLGLKVASAAEPEVAIDYTPGEARNISNRACDQIIAVLERSGTPVQVPGDQIHKNPFLLQESKPAVEQPGEDPSERDRKRRAEDEAKKARDRQGQIEQTLANVKLLGVLGGKVPVARLNGDTVRVGDTVGELFTVTAITGRSVTLQCDGKDYVISMEDPKQAKTNGAAKPAPKQQK